MSKGNSDRISLQPSRSLHVRGIALAPNFAERVSYEHFGLQVTAKLLAGEKDSNFHLVSTDGREFLLKVVNPGEDPGVTDLHTAALLHVESTDPTLPVQRIVRSTTGEANLHLDFPNGERRAVRMVTYIRGQMQRNTPTTPQLLFNVGALLGRLQLALQDFSHPSAKHESTWDLLQASSLRELFSVVPESDKRDRLSEQLDYFENTVLSKVKTLRAQVLHNDLNSDNVVVNPDDQRTIAGIIDFGDMIHTAVIADVAVAVAYQMSDNTNPLDTSLQFLRGFNSVRVLQDEEIELLYDLVMTRMVTRIAITEWRAIQFPENRNYILRNTPKSWAQFDKLRLISRKQATHDIREACRKRS